MKNFNVFYLILFISLFSTAADNKSVDESIVRKIKGPITIFIQTNNVTGEKLKAGYDSLKDKYIAYRVYVDKYGHENRFDLTKAVNYYKKLEKKYAGLNEPVEVEERIREPREI